MLLVPDVSETLVTENRVPVVLADSEPLLLGGLTLRELRLTRFIQLRIKTVAPAPRTFDVLGR